jgi:hypothetical protein
LPFGERRDDAKDSQWGGDGGDDDGGGGRDDDNGDNDDEGGGRTPTPPPTLSIVSRVRMPRGIDVRDRSFFVFVVRRGSHTDFPPLYEALRIHSYVCRNR